MTGQNNSELQQTYPGRLQVSAFAQDIGKPLNNASVKISFSYDKTKTVEELVTNNSGQTDTVNLAAPPLAYSLQPGDKKPYAEYDVTVTVDGYHPLTIEKVQILPNVKALQSVRLQPIVETELPVNISVEQHTLWGVFPPKIPEDSVKPLPESLGFVVLPNPVVPEFIIVHEGIPSDTSARNLYIPFKDYIKNVASCEIYSTWPSETIKANVLAILSFTLNRVYTEWYRGKGYNFTVTNSTAYDQAFSYERNIFEEISATVDDLFTTFVTKPEIRQPLFTQYCDGIRTSCPNWLQQWGSKTLGEQGYNAIDILKNYYGQDIFLLGAKKVAGIPVSYPGTALQTGSTGANVRTIQEQLNAISNNYPAIAKLRVDGVFGAKTRDSVVTFQNIFSLPASGVVDFATWYKISDVYVAVAGLAEAK